MADNITLNAGSGGSSLRTDDDGTAHWQYVKIAYGADNTQNIVGSISSNPFPVALSDTDNAVLDSINTALGGTLTVGSHAVTNAGTFAVQVDGSALTALQLIDDVVYADDAAFTLGTSKGVMMMGFAGTQSVDANDAAALACDVDGALHIADGGNSITVDNGGTFAVQVDAALPAGPNAIGKLAANSGVDIGDVDVTSVPTDPFGADADAASTTGSISAKLRSIATDVSAVTSGSTFQVAVVSALPDGSNAIGKLAANSGVDIGDVDVLSIAAGSNKIGDVGIGTRTSGGVSVYYDNDLDETAVAVNASPGQIYFIHAINLHTAPLYLQLFNVAQGSVTVGTTPPTMQFVIPSQGTANGAGFTLSIPMGIAFGTAITAAATTDSEGNGAPGANLCHVNIGYA